MDYENQLDINWIQDRYLNIVNGQRQISPKSFDLDLSNYFAKNYLNLIALECDKHPISPRITASRDHRIIAQDEHFVLKIPNGSFLDDSSLIFDPANKVTFKHQYLDSVYSCSEWVSQQQNLSIQQQTHLTGNTLLLNVVWGGVYSHFLFSVLGKLRNFLYFGNTLDDIDHIVVPEIKPFMQECFALLGIPAHKLIGLPSSGTNHHPGHLITTDQLYVPSAAMPANVNSAAFIRSFALQEAKKNSTPNNLLYISRINSIHKEGRHILNEDDIYHQILKPLGFMYVIEENLSLVEKAHLYQSAKIVIAPGGSGTVSHASFIQQGTVFIEIMHPHFIDFVCADVVQHMGGHYYYHVAQTDGSANIVVDAEKMQRIVNQFMI
jgi:capsular polysaccharide biosynthesis protein